MFDSNMEIRRFFNNKLVMTGEEDEKLLKLHGIFYRSRNFAYLTHQEKRYSII